MKKYVIKPQGIPENIYKSLDAEQLNAVLNARGRSIVVAGPGSGKTRVITYKIAHLIHQGVKPSEILLVTFTRAASKEMIERAKTVTGKDLSDMLAGTFHHVCNVFLRKYAPLVGLDRNYTIMDREDSESLVRHARSKILEKMGREL
ncbi:MAG: ATP-dependent helicase, partial [Thermotogae bacterium]